MGSCQILEGIRPKGKMKEIPCFYCPISFGGFKRNVSETTIRFELYILKSFPIKSS